jgi:hypothetical protein
LAAARVSCVKAMKVRTPYIHGRTEIVCCIVKHNAEQTVAKFDSKYRKAAQNTQRVWMFYFKKAMDFQYVLQTCSLSFP